MPPLKDHLTIESRIDAKTGEHQYRYYYKGKPCPTHLLKGQLPKQFIGYSLIMRDLEDALGWLTQAYDLFPQKKSSQTKSNQNRYWGERIGDEKNHRTIKSLFFSSLIFYGKCFTSAEGRGVKLEKSILPPEYHDRHNHILNYRHTRAAHSGIGKWDTGKARLVIPPQRGKDIGWYLYPELNRLDFEDDGRDNFSFLGLIKIVQDHVQTKKEKIFNIILKKMIVVQPEDYWYRSSPKSKKNTKR